jgi:hypothetical protein
VRRNTTIGVLLSLLAALLAPSAEAQGPWLISAGRGWGPILLGMTEEAVMSALGQPDNPRTVSGSIVFRKYSSRGVVLFFSRPGGGDFTLGGIHITSPRFATREGIRVGSSLTDVVHAYGDSLDTADKQSVRSCLNISLLGSRSASFNTPDYSDLFWWITYEDRGIKFKIVPEGSVLRVWEIDVEDPDPSRCVVTPY